jgi:perosamine synthetase
MSRLPEILKRREEVAARYSAELCGISEVTAPPVEIPHVRQCWFVYVVRLSERFTRAERDAVCIQLNAAGIGCGRYFPPLHLQPLYTSYAAGRELPITEHVAARTLALPFFNRLTGEQIVDVCRGLKDAIAMVLQARNT